MTRVLILAISLLFFLNSTAQKNKNYNTEKVWRVNLLNPAIEFEFPTGNHSTFSSALGIGYGGAYPDLTYNGSGFVYIINPFMDLQQKWYYNLETRMEKGKSTDNNSANFISLRFLSRGHSIAENINRTSDFDFAFGPTWGIQRKFGRSFHFLFDIGPIYYFDSNGNGNFYPIMLQLNLGIDL